VRPEKYEAVFRARRTINKNLEPAFDSIKGVWALEAERCELSIVTVIAVAGFLALQR
jgi:hypothetical protein